MTITSLLPAILVAGPPHSGKSVLAYLLSQRLRTAQVAHILLRAAPDGEGDWAYQCPDEVRMHQRRKGVYTADLIEDLLAAIGRRSLPMLVDIGGQPRDTQFRLFDACTHSIHLWREDDDRHRWATWLEERSLIPIADLQTRLTPPDCIEPGAGPLRGVITGLDRANPQPGPRFERVLERVQGICTYPQEALEAEHLRQAPAGVPQLTVTQLADEIGVLREGKKLWWTPEHLDVALAWLSPGQPLAFYGPGPLWLYAGIAARVAPASLYVFDARFYGWMQPPPVRTSSRQANAEFTLAVQETEAGVSLRFDLLPQHHVLHPRPIHVPPLPADAPVVLDGKMPTWVIAALAQALRGQPCLAAYDPRLSQNVIFWRTA
jgi:CRISPR-associated protein Csx3